METKINIFYLFAVENNVHCPNNVAKLT